MRLIFTQFDSQWVELTGLGGKLLTSVRYGIKPGYRKFDTPSQHWLIHWSQLAFVVTLARTYALEVEYGTLPTTWQLKAAGAEVLIDSLPAGPDETPFGKLFITDDAPIEVVHAAYRALARMHHPDIGGVTARFQEVDAAYRKVLQLRGCE